MKIGAQVELVQPVITGEITDTRYNKEAECLEHLVVYKDASGVEQQRWFTEAELKELTNAGK